MPRWNIQIDIDSRGVVTGAARAGTATQGMATKMSAADRVVMGLQRTLKTLGVFLGGAVLARGFRSFVGAMAEQETAVRRMESRLRGIGPEALASSAALQQMASNLQRATGVGDEEILRLQSVLLTFRRIGPEIFGDLTETVLDVATVMGTDAKSAALQLGKALDDPARRVSELSRAGITFTQQQQDVIKALVETGNLLEAQKLVLGEVRAQYGRAARDEGETLRKKIDELGNSWSDFMQAVASSSGANNPIVAVVQAGIDILRGAVDFLGDFDNQWNAFMLSIERGARRILAINLQLAEFMPGNQNEEGLRRMIAVIDEGLADRIPKYVAFMRELATEVSGVQPELGGFGVGVERAGNQAGEAAEQVRTLADAVEEASERMGEAIGPAGGLAVRLEQFRSERSAQIISDAFGGDLPQELAITLADQIGEEAAKALTEATERAALDAAPGFADEIGARVGQAIANAILSGDVTGAIDGLSRTLGVMAGESISRALGGGIGGTLASSIAGPLVGALAGELLGGIFGGKPAWVDKFIGSVDVFSAAAGELANAAANIRNGLLRLENALGSSILGSKLSVTQTGPDQFRARLGGIAEGTGATIEEAAQAALDAFASALLNHIAFGNVDLSGVAEEISRALGSSLFSSFDEMISAIELWQEALNAGTNALGAWTPATDAAMQRIAAMRLEIERSGLSAEAAAPMLAELGRAAEILTSQARGGFLSSIADVMERMGLNSAQVARFRARAEQISFQLTVAKLKIEAAALGFVGAFWSRLFAQFDAWAANINNFVVATANIVTPIIRAAPSVARDLSSGLERLRESLREYLAGLSFTAPGSPRPTKTGLEAALEEARRAAGEGDVDAFKRASDAALAIAQELFGSTMGFDDILAQIREIGQFDPVEQIDPIVAAIGDLGSSIAGNFGQLGTDLGIALENTAFYIGDNIGRDILALGDRNRDGLISIAESQGLMSGAVFDLLDVNRDGFLDLEELNSQSALSLFRLLDINRDGFLSIDELRRANKTGLLRLLEVDDAGFLRLSQQQFDLLDVNRNGFLEVGEIPLALVNLLDANQDGFVSVREANAYIIRQLLDANQDGFLQLGEVNSRDLFKLLDANRDGFLSLEEVGGESARATFDLLDANQDGFLSLEETNRAAIFSLLDVNQDGNLTLEELLGAVRELPTEFPTIPPIPEFPSIPPVQLPDEMTQEFTAMRQGIDSIDNRLLNLNNRVVITNDRLLGVQDATEGTDTKLRNGITVYTRPATQ